jgi:hypothetical protein
MSCAPALAVVGRSPRCGLVPLALLFLLSAAPLAAQTIDDGIMLSRGALFGGVVYSHDSWETYWEGTLERTNGNIGTLTTQANMLFGNYGVTDRLNVMATAPYVWTRASQGVLSGMQGFQDLTVAAKYRLFDRGAGPLGSMRVIAVGSGSVPLTHYTPDFAPLSIGSASKRVAGRLTLNTHADGGLYLNGSTAYTWRGGVTLDRPYYYTDGEFFLTDEVDMPNVLDYIVSAGYMKGGLMATGSFSQQYTLGGGDIRRQDMPFVSNRMNASRVGAMVMTAIPKLHGLSFHGSWAHTVSGRNVGQATTLTAGLLYTHPFVKGKTR